LSTNPTEKLEIAAALSEEPEVRASPAGALGLRRIPTELHFRRSHFATPSPATGASLSVGGLRELAFTAAELRRRADRTVAVVLECAGHRRSELDPAAAGVQWGVGAVSEAEWTGVPLRELLLEAGVPPAARAVVLHGRDRGRRGTSELPVHFARAIPVEKALAEETLVAWAMNGEAIPAVHGGPLRAIVPGHYGVDSVKWLDRVTVLEQEFEGPFQRLDYRFFADAADERGEELHELPVHALLLAPAPGRALRAGQIGLSGIAWGGAGGPARVEVALDGGAWRQAELERTGEWGRAFWRLDLELVAGPNAVAVRATDAAGGTQPERPRWNRLGYANNSVQRVLFDAV
jgi:DMSO/TMAO reductase YedYZ molybdopterin-dependent catalytic subunit